MTTNPSLLLYAQTGSAITSSTHAIILLPFNQDNPAMTTTSTHAQNLLLPSIQDNPAITMMNNANSKLQLIFESLFLLRNEDNSETMAPSLLLFCIKDAPAIMTAPLANFSLQLIIDYLSLPCDFERPAITMATHAEYSLQLIVESLFLLRDEDNSKTMASSLLLFCVKDAPAIMMATHADYSLQLIVESLFTGAKQVASAYSNHDMVRLLAVAVGIPAGDVNMRVSVHEDNLGALVLAETLPPQFTPRSKYYATKTIWFRE
jgi:hypothetical protein